MVVSVCDSSGCVDCTSTVRCKCTSVCCRELFPPALPCLLGLGFDVVVVAALRAEAGLADLGEEDASGDHAKSVSSRAWGWVKALLGLVGAWLLEMVHTHTDSACLGGHQDSAVVKCSNCQFELCPGVV